jgi:hypothetical protein
MRVIWVYAYQIVPPQPSRRLGGIRVLLDEETAATQGLARLWSGRLVLERRITHILIVTDDPGQNEPINRRLVFELDRIAATYSLTLPLAVAGHADGLGTSNGNGK